MFANSRIDEDITDDKIKKSVQRLFRDESEQSDYASALDRERELALVLRTSPRSLPREDFLMVVDETAESIGIFIIDIFDIFSAENTPFFGFDIFHIYRLPACGF
jgi:hypothetical protein